MCTKTNNHQNPNKNNRIRQSTIIQLQSDSTPLQAAGHKPLPAQARFGTDGAEAGPLAVWASLLARTSAARPSALTAPDAAVQTTPSSTQTPPTHHATAGR